MSEPLLSWAKIAWRRDEELECYVNDGFNKYCSIVCLFVCKFVC